MATSQTCNLDICDLIDVLDLLKKCSFQRTKWQELGLRIGLVKDTLEAIETKYHGDVNQCLTECLSQWLRRADNVDSRGGANLDSLSNALGSMNETAVAEKLKHHVFVNIFNNRHTVLSQSLCDPVSIAWLLYGERMLTQEAVSRVVSASPSIPNQREALLTAVKEAVQTDPNSLHTFANVLCTISTNVSLGQTILDDISKYFPTPEVGVVPEISMIYLCYIYLCYIYLCYIYVKDHDVVPQGSTANTEINTSTIQVDNTDSSPSNVEVTSNLSSQPLSPQAGIQVPVSKGLQVDFKSMRMSYGRMIYHVKKIIEQKSPPLEEMKELISCCSADLKRKAEQCNDLSGILRLIQNECSLTDIELLHSVVEEMNIAEADELIKTYKTKLKEFCKSLSISLCLKERFASIPPLQCVTVTLVFDWKPEEHMLEDIKEILAKASGKLLQINYIEHSSICVTCSFPFSDVGFTVLRMIESIHILMEQGLKKLTIGNLTLWRRQDARQKELKEKDQDLLQHTEVISYIILEEAEYKLRDIISSKEKESIELKQEISMAQVTEEESLPVQRDTESVKEAEEEPLYEELTVLRSQFNEIQKENEELSDKLSKMKIEYLRSLTSNTDSAASKLRRGMAFEIDDCKFYLQAMTRPDYQPLVDNKRLIEKLQERISLMNMELMTEREHNEKIIKDIKDHLKETEGKEQKTEEEMCKIYLYCNHPVAGKLKKSFLKAHKDELLPSVLDKAYELMELAPHIPIERCRLVKYDYWNKVMEQSFDGFQHLTIGQIVGRAEYLFLETCKENETFKKYNYGGVSLEVSVVDLSTGGVGPAVPVRGEEGWTVEVLKQHIGEFCTFMMEYIVAKGTPVGEIKKQIIEEAKVQGIDCVLELDK
uniref:Death domain-containing protein n=1 Tax=Amphimedon queenslandica TaxID=400682 RepID=A0A1X7VPT0_AMPQE